MCLIESAIVGCILGTAVGDALGLAYEGVSRTRSPRLLGPPDRYRFLFGKGMMSDDTEHTCMVAQSLIEAGNDVGIFTNRFAKRLRWWLLALPAGVGKATALSGFKLWLGFPFSHSGVFSAGNGPAMRAGIFGAVFDDENQMLRLVQASSRLTHRDPKAEFGAMAVALAARESRQNEIVDGNRWLEAVTRILGKDGRELTDLLRLAVSSAQNGETTLEFCNRVGQTKGISGYTYHTVPACIHAWLNHPRDISTAITSIIACGGDADTTAAIVGGIIGSGVGREGIPDYLVNGLFEWPRSVRWMELVGTTLAEAIVDGKPRKAPGVNPVSVLLRNLIFLSIVLFHGFRRLAPPY